ncbi:hypothetical protein N4T77_06710 [Clostridium sp. CX1]|uniref:hypothetical protein n=1 Tax=Clostridium sp. CX1 TaxID=2978346 RepID=UPI0021C055D4|nr:hypothetical protein [Clostridium sp. CX1]MCT8976284.1 hypothetical protein [Clostridium sp. CX1]
MLKGILTFLQILDLIGKWISKAIKNYHITLGIILFVNIVSKISEHEGSLLSVFNVILIMILAIRAYRKYYCKRILQAPIINIKNENNITNVSGNKNEQ